MMVPENLYQDIGAGRPLKDYLGEAARAGREAKTAVKERRLDDAWRLYHEQKTAYLQHAGYLSFRPHETLRLDASVHENLANILRIEKKEDDAFVHILYWVIAQASWPAKRHQEKLRAYFERCKLQNTTLKEIKAWAKSDLPKRDFFAAQTKAAEWFARG